MTAFYRTVKSIKDRLHLKLGHTRTGTKSHEAGGVFMGVKAAAAKSPHQKRRHRSGRRHLLQLGRDCGQQGGLQCQIEALRSEDNNNSLGPDFKIYEADLVLVRSPARRHWPSSPSSSSSSSPMARRHWPSSSTSLSSSSTSSSSSSFSSSSSMARRHWPSRPLPPTPSCDYVNIFSPPPPPLPPKQRVTRPPPVIQRRLC